MSTLIKVEILKLKRYNILILGVCTTFGTVMIAVYQAWSMRFYGMDFSGIADFVLWDGLTLLMPFTIALIGGFILKRELTDHTLPAVLMVPVSESKLLAAKLIITAIVTEFLVLFEYIMTIGAAFMLGVGGSITGIFLNLCSSGLLLSSQCCPFLLSQLILEKGIWAAPSWLFLWAFWELWQQTAPPL